MIKRSKDSVDYYVVFCKSNNRHWIFRFLDPYFQHCYAIKKSPGGQFWIEINPTKGRIEVNMYSIDQFPTIRSLVGSKTVLRVASSGEAKTRVWNINCVEIVKQLLGVTCSAWTPRQLYNYLRG